MANIRLPSCVPGEYCAKPLLQLVGELLETGKKRLVGDTARQASSPEMKGLRREAKNLKEAVAELTLGDHLLKISMIGDGSELE